MKRTNQEAISKVEVNGRNFCSSAQKRNFGACFAKYYASNKRLNNKSKVVFVKPDSKYSKYGRYSFKNPVRPRGVFSVFVPMPNSYDYFSLVEILSSIDVKQEGKSYPVYLTPIAGAKLS